MIPAPEFDRSLGIELYMTDTEPCGGRIKERPEDFIVEEVLEGGHLIAISGAELPRSRPGPWLLVHVVKRDVDTLKLIEELRRTLKLKGDEIKIGGIKDARAVASHVISLYKIRPEDLPRIPGVVYKDFAYADAPITPARIEGNKFTVVIRETDCGCALKTAELLRNVPIANYYGYQRFGTIRPTSHLLGRALVKRDPEEFLNVMFCKIFEGESELVKEARLLACRGDYDKALEKMPKSMLEERALLKALSSGQSLWNAIAAIPRNILKIYLEAYQAYLFNRMLSLRLREGIATMPDDLVMLGNYPILASHAGGAGIPVLPVPGAGIVVPESRAREYLRKILREEGLELQDFAAVRVSVSGSYRRVFVEPRDLAYSCKGGEMTISFILPRGSYATLILREIIKPRTPHLHGF